MIVHAAGNLHNNNTSNSTQNNNAGQNAFMSFADGSSNNGGAQMQQQQQPQQPNGNGQMPFGMYPHPQYVTVQQGQPNMLMQNNPNNGGYGFPPNGYFYVPQFGSSMGFQQMDNGMFQMMPPMMQQQQQQQQQQPQQPQQSAASTPPPMQTNSINSNSNNKNGTDNSNNVINNNSGSSSSSSNNNNNSSSMNNTMMNNTNMPSSIATSAMPSSSDATKNSNLSGNQPQLQFLQQPYSSTLKSSTPAPSTSHQQRDQNNNNTTNNTTPTPSANGTSTTSKSPSSIPPVVMMAPQGMTVAGVLFVPGPNSPPSTQPQFVPVAPDQTGAPGVVVQGSMPSFPGAINAAISFMNNKPPSSIMESVQSSYFPSSSINSDDSDSNGSASSGSGTSGLSRPKNRNSGGSGVYPSSSSNSGGAQQQQQQQQQQNNEPNTGRNNSNKSQMTAHATPGNHQPQQQQQALPSTFTPHVNAFLQQMGKDFTRPFNGSQPASQSQASQTSQTSHQPQAQQQQQQQQQQQPGPQHMLQQPHAMHPHAFIPAGHMHQPGMPQGMPTQFMPIFDRSSPNGQPILMGHQIAPMGMFSMEDFYDLNKRRFNTSSSKYRGVSWHRRDRKWLARTWINGRIEHLGCFRSEEMAALAVDLRTIEHFGESRKELNFPDPEERKRLKEIFTKTGEFRLRSAEDLAQKGGSHNSGVSGQGSNDGGASTQGSKETSETDTPPSEVGNINSAGHSSKHHSKRDSNNSRSSNDNSSSDSERKSDDLVSDSVGPKISSFARDKSISSRSSDSSSNGSSSDKRSDEFFSKSSDRSSSKRSVPSSATASSISLPINKRRKSDKAGHSSSASVIGSSKSAMA